MRKEELIKLAKELSELEDLTGREDDLAFLKKEYTRLLNKEDETFFEKTLTNEFMSYYSLLGNKAPSLNKSSLEDKKDILSKAYALLQSSKDMKNLNKNINDLFNDFKHLPRISKEVDDPLFEEFRAIKEEAAKKVDAYYEGIKKSFQERATKKEALIEEAKKVLELENIKEATSKMDALMEEWKQVGFAGKELDEELWNKFKEVRKEFQAKRKAHFEHMEEVFVERATKKAELIKKVKYITSEAYFTDEEVKQIKDIEREFRNLGFAGKEKDQDLWNEMQAAIKKYFEELKFYK